MDCNLGSHTRPGVVFGRTDQVTDSQWGWIRTPQSKKLLELEREYNALVKQPSALLYGAEKDNVSPQVIELASKIELLKRKLQFLTRKVPLILDPEVAKELGIDGPDWEVSRKYIRTLRSGGFPVVGENNIGLIRFERDGTNLEQQLFTREGGTVKAIRSGKNRDFSFAQTGISGEPQGFPS